MKRNVLLFMRLCGHDCLVSGRYDPGSAGSGRYFYRLDPQNPLDFGRNFLSLSINARWRGDPHAGCRIGTHRVHGGTDTWQIGNACVRGRSFFPRDLSANHLTNWHKVGRQGGGLGSTLVSTKRGSRNATGQPCWLQTGIDPLCQSLTQPQPVGTLAHTNPEPAPSGSTIHHIRARDPERHRITQL